VGDRRIRARRDSRVHDPSAATTINDELEKVEALGIKIVADDEVEGLKWKVESLELRDFDFELISKNVQRLWRFSG
jgi:uncharacterized protein (DUF1786 family)